MQGNSTPARRGSKPAKPSADFPLFPHASGSWCKKIHGKLYSFGGWRDPQAALAKYEAQKDDLHAGRVPRSVADEVAPQAATVKDVANAWLNAKKNAQEAGELSPLSFTFYQEVATVLVEQLGKHTPVAALKPADFSTLRRRMSASWGPVRLANAVTFIRGMFRYAVACGLIEKLPLFGPEFVRPSHKTLRVHRAAQGVNLFTPAEVRQLLAAAEPTLRALILIGINTGIGASDLGRMPATALDLEAGWLNFARFKTGIARRCPLWPETVAAIREALAVRSEPRHPVWAGLVIRPEPMHHDWAGLAFLTPSGHPWSDASVANTKLGEAVRRLLRRLGINGRKRLGFYTLRHCFATAGDAARDPVALSALLGHADGSMAGHYRERISDERLRAVADHVRAWLFGAHD
jgi:integrase